MTNYNPPAAFYFKVEFGIDGAQENGAMFQEVSGLSAEVNIEEYREGGENRFVHKLPKGIKYSNLCLKRGLITDPVVFKWINNSVNSDLSAPIKPRDLIVSLLGTDTKPVIKWKVSNAWPVKFETAQLDPKSSKLAVESIEFAYNRIEKLSV
jgi:phage tail-like protein